MNAAWEWIPAPGRTKDLEKKNKECREYAEKYPRPHLVNTMGQRTHIKCRDCPWWSHSLHNNPLLSPYQSHLFSARGTENRKRTGTFFTDPERQFNECKCFCSSLRSLSCGKDELVMQSCTRFTCVTMKNYAPSEQITEEILNALGNNHRVMRDWEKDLANEIWEKMISKIDIHPFFGVAVDAGVDSVLNEHVLVGVVYVSDEQYLLPPMYHPKRKAFNGKETAESLVNTLNSILGITLVRKMRFFNGGWLCR